MTKASAIANANIALVKYWGKRNPELMLPQTGSISMTTHGLYAHTTVEFDDKYKEDVLILDKKEYRKGDKEYDEYVGRFIGVVRKMYPGRAKQNVRVASENNFPTAAGLASSAAGFAALAVAVNEALELGLDRKRLSMLARMGSGSATRSIYGGFVEWHRGNKEDGSDCFAEQLFPPEHWKDFRMVIAVTSKKYKKIKSRAGMSASVKTSPFYEAWRDKVVPHDIKVVKEALARKDFGLLGRTAELNALRMHAVAISTEPPIIYWNAGTMNIIHSVLEWREHGLECYFTIDAGPQVKIMCLERDVEEIKGRLKSVEGVEDVIVTMPGGDARVVEEHLF